MPISGLVVTFQSPVAEHTAAVGRLRQIPEVELGPSGGSKLAIVIESTTKRRDKTIWTEIEQLPGVVDLSVAMVAFDDDSPD